MTELAPTPWQYRPLEFDDWGTIRAADGAVVARARSGSHAYVDEDMHRAAGTDPYEPVARLIIGAVNAAAELATLAPPPSSELPAANNREVERRRALANALHRLLVLVHERDSKGVGDALYHATLREIREALAHVIANDC